MEEQSEEHSEKHWEEHSDDHSVVHSVDHSEDHPEQKQKVHLDVMSIRTMLDAQMTVNRHVDWSSPSEERSTGD